MDEEKNTTATTGGESTASSQAEKETKSQNKANSKHKLPKWARAWIKLLIKIAVIAGICVLVWTFVGQTFILHDNNMYPHMKDGDLIIVYKLQDIIKNNVVLYVQDGEKRVGRVIGYQDDVIVIDENGLYTVNDGVPYENVFYNTKTDESSMEFPYVVPNGQYFLLNDMRENTEDSRRFGSVNAEDIIGTVVFIARHREF